MVADKTYKVPENPVYNTEIRKINDEDPVSASEILNPVLERMMENTAAVKAQADSFGENFTGQPARMYVETDDGAVTIPGISSYEEMAGVPYTIMPTSRFVPEWPYEAQEAASGFGRDGGITTHACISPEKDIIIFGGPVQDGVPTLSAVKVNCSLSDWEAVELFAEDELPGTVTDMAISSDGRLLVVTHEKNPNLNEGDEHLCLSMYLKNEAGVFARISDPLSSEATMKGPRRGRTTCVKFQPVGNLFVVTCMQADVVQPCMASIYRYDGELGTVSYVKDVFSNPNIFSGVYSCDWSSDGAYIGFAARYNNGSPQVFHVEDSGTTVTVKELNSRWNGSGDIYTIKFIPNSSPVSFLCLGTEQWWCSQHYYILEYDDDYWYYGEIVEKPWSWYANWVHEFPDLSESLYVPNITFTKSQYDTELYVVVSFYDQKPSLHRMDRETELVLEYMHPYKKLNLDLHNVVVYNEEELLALSGGRNSELPGLTAYRYKEYFPALNINGLGDVPLFLVQRGDILSGVPFTVTYDQEWQVFLLHDPSKDNDIRSMSDDIYELRTAQEALPEINERSKLHTEKNAEVSIPHIESYEDMSNVPYTIIPTSVNERLMNIPYAADGGFTDLRERGYDTMMDFPAFSPDGRHFVLGGTSRKEEVGALTLYYPSTDYKRYTVLENAFSEMPPTTDITCTCFSNDSQILAVGINASPWFMMYRRDETNPDHYILIDDPALDHVTRSLSVRTVAFAPDGKFFCTVAFGNLSVDGGDPGRVVIYAYNEETRTVSFHKSLSTVEVTPALAETAGSFTDCDWSVDGKYLAVSNYGGKYGIYVYERTEEEDFLHVPSDYDTTYTWYTNHVSFGRHDKIKHRIFTTHSYSAYNYNGSQNVFEINAEKRVIERIDKYEAGFYSGAGASSALTYNQNRLCWTPDKSWLIVLCRSTTPYLYKVDDKTGKLVKASTQLRELFDVSPYRCAFSPDGSVGVFTCPYIMIDNPLSVADWCKIIVYDPMLETLTLNINNLGQKRLTFAGEGGIEDNVPIQVSYSAGTDSLLVHNPSLLGHVRDLRTAVDTNDSGIAELTDRVADLEHSSVDNLSMVVHKEEDGVIVIDGIESYEGMAGKVYSVALSSIPKGKYKSEKIENSETERSGTVHATAVSPDGSFIAVGGLKDESYCTIYKRDGSGHYTYLNTPEIVTEGLSRDFAFSPDGNYFAMVNDEIPKIRIYRIEGDEFKILHDVDTPITGHGRCCTFSNDANYLAVGHGLSPYVYIYKRQGDTFTKLTTNVTALPAQPEQVTYNYDGSLLAVSHTSSPNCTIYRKNANDTYSKLTSPEGSLITTYIRNAFSPDGKYLYVSSSGGGPLVFEVSGTGVNDQISYKEVNIKKGALDVRTGGGAFSKDGRFLVVLYGNEIDASGVAVYEVEEDGLVQVFKESISTAGSLYTAKVDFLGDSYSFLYSNSSVHSTDSVVIRSFEENPVQININGLGGKELLFPSEGNVEENIPFLISYDPEQDGFTVLNPQYKTVLEEIRESLENILQQLK